MGEAAEMYGSWPDGPSSDWGTLGRHFDTEDPEVTDCDFCPDLPSIIRWRGKEYCERCGRERSAVAKAIDRQMKEAGLL
jgi:hypothetical protein